MAGRSELGSNRVAQAMALAGVTRVTLAKALRLTQSYASDVACGSYRTIAVENVWKFAAYFGCRIEDFSVTLPTVGLKAGRTLEVAGHPAVMSLVTPTPACSGEIDRERRPRCSIVDRAAGAAWRRDPCRSPSLSSSSRSGVPPAAVHHDGLMAAGRILADGIGMSPGARERARRFGPASRSVWSSAGCSPCSPAHSELHNRVARCRPRRPTRHFSPARVLGRPASGRRSETT